MDKIKLISQNILENENILNLIPSDKAEVYIKFLENSLIPYILKTNKNKTEKFILKTTSEIFKIILTIKESNKIEHFEKLFKILNS